MRALYALQQHVALCGIECKALLIVTGLFVVGLASTQLRADPLPYDEAFYAAPVTFVHHHALAQERPAQAAADPDSARSGIATPAEIASADAPSAAAERSGHSREALRMNLNRAGARLLTQLPGIGPKKAEAVVAYREAHGAFASVADLQQVRGIGPKTVEKLAPLLFVEAPAPPPDSAAPGEAAPDNQLASN